MDATIRLPASESQCIVGQYVVAYIDLLGQREVLQKLKGRPLGPEDEKSFQNLAIDCVRKIYYFRKNFKDFFDSFTEFKPDGLPRKLSPQDLETVKRYSFSEIRFQGFSDTLIIYFPLRSSLGHWQVNAINGLFLSLSLLMPTAIEMGLPFRAGIDAGVGAELVPGEIYGPVLQDAYKLEGEIANFPRIMVGDGLREFIQHLPDLPSEDVFRQMIPIMAESFNKLIVQDREGYRFLDYAGKEIREMRTQHWGKRIQNAHRISSENVKNFSEQGNEKVALKYKRVADYLWDRCGDFI